MVDVMCDEGKLARSYCLQCGSFNTQPLSKYGHLYVLISLNGW